jgi:hypothetical protein
MIVGGLPRDNQMIKEDLAAKMDRKRIVTTEHRYRKGSLRQSSEVKT